MKNSEYIVDFLYTKGIRDVFLVVGGAILPLIEAIRKDGRIRMWFNHNEQACAISAEGYAKSGCMPALVLTTSGPGATNAISGVFGAYVDSVPMFVISGQVKTVTINKNPQLRQLGDQEVNILAMVDNITSYSRGIYTNIDVKCTLFLAWEHMMQERKAPVWLDIPIDIQGAEYAG